MTDLLRDVVYARVGGKALLLDLYLPTRTAGPLPVILWVHGGGWMTGSKENPPAVRMAERGYGWRVSPIG
jgi:acetyl esterase/lipase